MQIAICLLHYVEAPHIHTQVHTHTQISCAGEKGGGRCDCLYVREWENRSEAREDKGGLQRRYRLCARTLIYTY